ncbi:hypothetical protein ACA910_001806 [Epithemia clementina (nom. ined.)]
MQFWVVTLLFLVSSQQRQPQCAAVLKDRSWPSKKQTKGSPTVAHCDRTTTTHIAASESPDHQQESMNDRHTTSHSGTPCCLHRRAMIVALAVAPVSSLSLLPSLITTGTPNQEQQNVLSSFFGSAAFAAETVGKDENCNESNCLGVWDGLLANCPSRSKTNGMFGRGSGAGCVSSQDDTPAIFAEPWDYSESVSTTSSTNDDNDGWEGQMQALKQAIASVCAKRGDQVQTLEEQGRYLRVLFTDGPTGEESIGEFYFTLNDTTVQFRVSSLDLEDDDSTTIAAIRSFASHKPLGNPSNFIHLSPPSLSSSWTNRERCERIRKELMYQKLVVLRNRKRSLFFVESDQLDTFGPSSNSEDLFLGPPTKFRR